jgi:hypothetical protein
MNTVKFIFLLVLGTAFTFPAADLKLEYSFKVGDQYNWVQSTKQSIKQTIPGMGEMTMDVNTEGTILLKVVETTTNGAKVEAQYSKLKVVSKTPMGDVNMDSESQETDNQTKVTKSIMGKTFYFFLTKRGIVEKVEGTDNLYSGLNDLGLDEAALASVKQALQQTLGASSLKGNLEMALVNYPENKVKAGDSWKHSTGLPMNFPVRIDNTWNLKKIEGSVATVDADGKIVTTDKDQTTALPNGLKSKMDLTGQQASVGKVNAKTGWPTEIKILSEIKGKMILLAGGMIPEDMEVPMVITTESTFTIEKK